MPPKQVSTLAGLTVIAIYLLFAATPARQYVQYEGVLAYVDSLEPTTAGTANLVNEVHNLNPTLTHVWLLLN